MDQDLHTYANSLEGEPLLSVRDLRLAVKLASLLRDQEFRVYHRLIANVRESQMNDAQRLMYARLKKKEVRMKERELSEKEVELQIAFLQKAMAEGHGIVVLDIPLLFETGGDKRADAILVVSAPPEVQRARVLARGQMTEAEFEAILARQVPDSVKRSRADFIIDTSQGFAAAEARVEEILAELRKRLADTGSDVGSGTG
jgi:dephospho-CoA kinase